MARTLKFYADIMATCSSKASGVRGSITQGLRELIDRESWQYRCGVDREALADGPAWTPRVDIWRKPRSFTAWSGKISGIFPP